VTAIGRRLDAGSYAWSDLYRGWRGRRLVRPDKTEEKGSRAPLADAIAPCTGAHPGGTRNVPLALVP